MENTPEDTPEWEIFTRYLTLTKLVRIAALMQLFVHNCQNKLSKNRITNSIKDFILSPTQLQAGLTLLIKASQAKSFPIELKALTLTRQIPSRSALLKLRPILVDGCIRVGGRLQRANLPFNEKHLFIVARNTNFARLLVEDAHVATLHGGSQLTQRHVANSFWILYGRSLVQSIIRGCVICTRF